MFKSQILDTSISLEKTINVATGEVKIGKADNIIVSNGIGSCIVVVAFDQAKQIGASAHIMLPGRAPINETQNKTKYAVDAIDELLQLMLKQGTVVSDLRICLVGAGNVLRKEDDTLCKMNIQSIINILNKKKLEIVAKSVGGFERRTVMLDIRKGCVYFTLGDSKQQILWNMGCVQC